MIYMKKKLNIRLSVLCTAFIFAFLLPAAGQNNEPFITIEPAAGTVEYNTSAWASLWEAPIFSVIDTDDYTGSIAQCTMLNSVVNYPAAGAESNLAWNLSDSDKTKDLSAYTAEGYVRLWMKIPHAMKVAVGLHSTTNVTHHTVEAPGSLTTIAVSLPESGTGVMRPYDFPLNQFQNYTGQALQKVFLRRGPNANASADNEFIKPGESIVLGRCEFFPEEPPAPPQPPEPPVEEGQDSDVNIALGKAVSASAFVDKDGVPAPNLGGLNTLTDGNTSSSIYSGTGFTGDITVDLGAKYAVNILRIFQGPNDLRTMTYNIDISENGTEWTNIVTNAVHANNEAGAEYQCETKAVRYIRWSLLSYVPPDGIWYGFRLAEIEAYCNPEQRILDFDTQEIDLGDTLHVTKNLTLNTSGSRGAQIVWSTDNSKIVDINGRVVRPEWTQADESVNLTARVSYAGKSRTRVIPVTVLKKNMSTGKTVTADTTEQGFSASGLTDDDPDTIWKPSTMPSWITLDLGESFPFDSAVIDVEATQSIAYILKCSNDNAVWSEVSTGTLDNPSNILNFSLKSARYIRVEFSGADPVGISGIKISVSDAELILADKNVLTIDADLTNVTAALLLPIKGKYGSDIIWSSNNTSVITNDGTVYRQAADITVILTALISLNGQEETKTFSAKVTKKEAGNTFGGGGGGGYAGGGSSGGGFITAPISSTPAQKTPETVVASFNDLGNSEWARRYIEDLAFIGVVNGVSSDSFEPDRNITREEFVKVLVSGFKIPLTSDNITMSDIHSDAWYYPFISTAVKEGIVQGIGDGLFGLGMPITRQDMAVMINRTQIATDTRALFVNDNPLFPDSDDISDYAYEAVRALFIQDIINGDDTGAFRPKSYATRAEVCKVIHKVLFPDAEEESLASQKLINYAARKPVTVSTVQNSSFFAYSAVDEDMNTRWSSVEADNQWLIVDLGKTENICRAKIYWGASAKEYAILVSNDGENWSQVYHTEDGRGYTEEMSFDMVSARYVKIDLIKRSSIWQFQISELELYGR